MIEQRFRYFYTAIVAFIAVSGIIDLYLDDTGHGLNRHQIVEIIFLVVAVLSVIFLWITLSRRLSSTKEMLFTATKELEVFRTQNRSVLEAMRDAVHIQFQKWKFSPSEVKIAELLIRGYSSRQIAGILNKSDRTVRNQAISIYQKSGMTGRHDLAAFFLLDVLGEEAD